MARPKGIPKTGGRQSGSVNKTTAAMREWITQIISENQDLLRKDLSHLVPRERWQVVEKLLGYVVPKLQSVENTLDLSNLSEEELDAVIQRLNDNMNYDNRD